MSTTDLTCINAPIDGDPGKRWDGRAGQACAGPVTCRPSLFGTGTVALCEVHAADQAAWRADLDSRQIATAGSTR